MSAALAQLSQRLRASRVPEQRVEPDDLEVMLALPAWSVMRSTDREYIYERFPQLNQRFKLRFVGNHGLRSLALSNVQYTIERFAPHAQVPFVCYGSVPGLQVARSTHVIFSYGQFPMDLKAEVPILWEHTFAPQRSLDEAAWHKQLRAVHLRAATQATRVVTATEISVAWFCRVFPEFAAKITAIPYYLPNLSTVDAAALEEKSAHADKLRVLFVGKQARRKGLDTLVSAWELLSAPTRRALSVTVVSGMYDGRISLPADWVHHSSVPDVNVLMRQAHMLAFPTKHEAYGLVLVEGLAAGCAILTTCAEIQRSIVGDAAGSFIDPSAPEQLAEALSQLVSDRDRLQAKMFAARERFVQCYAPNVVGASYAKLLWDTAGRHTDDLVRLA